MPRTWLRGCLVQVVLAARQDIDWEKEEVRRFSGFRV